MHIKVKSKVDHLTIGDRTVMAGETADCPVDRAKYLVARGLVELVDEGERPTGVAKGDATEKAVSSPRSVSERQVKKG